MALDTQKLKVELEDELAELKSELQEIGIHNPDVKSDWIERGNDLNQPSADPNEVADRTEEYDERRATVATLETRYNNIRRALNKFEDGTYGICEVCDETIEPERLEANPAARTCLAHVEEESRLSS